MYHVDPTYTPDDFPSGNEYPEGILNSKSGRRYPTALAAMLDCDDFGDLSIYTDFRATSPASQKPIVELYAERMEQLREKYDYLELSWGGGHDSTMILEASKQSGCPIDLISMQVNGDPEKNSTGFNSEISNNLHHVKSYVKRFPMTKVRYLDISECYVKTVENYHDHKLWCQLTTMAMLDDVCRIGSDHFVPERRVDNGAILSGQGWKNAIYNKTLDIWSLFLTNPEVNQLGGISFHIPTVRFYETHDIMIKVGNDIRDWYNKADDHQRSQVNIMDNHELWTVNNEWVHDKIMYKGLDIFHDGKSKDWIIPWQESSRFDFWTKEKNNIYKEYYEWIKMLDKNIHYSCFLGKGGVLGDGLKDITAAVIDF